MFTRFRFRFAALLLAAGLLSAPGAHADTPNVPVSTGVQIVPLHLAGQVAADKTAAVAFKLPFPAYVLGVSATARASGGTSPTLTVDLLEGGTTILSAPIAVTAGAVAEGVLADRVLADEATITLDLVLGGTSPTWDDITVIVTLARQ